MEKRSIQERGFARRLTAAVIVAIGVAIVWGVVIGWGVAIVDAWTSTVNDTYELLSVTRSGIPVIQTYSNSNFQEITYRTLEGQPIDEKNNVQLQSAYLPPAAKAPRFFNWPMGWGQSLSATDGARPLGSWYLIRDNQPIGRAYFAGYDVFAKKAIGYIGRRGFRRSLPPRDECFDVGLSSLAYNTRAASTQPLRVDELSNLSDFVPDGLDISPWLVFVIDGDRVLEVDLLARTVRDVLTAKELASIGILTEVIDSKTFDSKSFDNYRVAVRSGDQVFVLNALAGTNRAYALPESLQRETLQVYSLGGEQILVTWTGHRGEERQTEHLVWIDSEGKVTREENFQLSQFAQRAAATSDRTSAVQTTGLVPIPLFWMAMLGIVPLSELQSNDMPSFAAAFAKTFDMSWPALLVVTGTGFLSAWLVWRSQRRYFRSHTGAWCAFAFLLGLPAVAAYWLEMRRAKLEACGECRTIVPRDRDACASCATPFPAPPLVGTELFA